WELEQVSSTEFNGPWPEKVLSVTVNTSQGTIEIHTVHFPNGSNHGWTKIDMFEAIYTMLACNAKDHRILCGDFNSPLDETTDGQIRTFGQVTKAPDGRYIITKKYERWDMGERNVMEGLRRYDLQDVFRSIHGYKKEAFSHYTNNRGNRIGRRFDHIFASDSLNVVKCEYLNRLRCPELSDHAPIEAVFNPNQR
ncbi:MAG: hypothetical protein M3Y82_04915, partial [Verrucomicrobiota bacterium]|nr:hypothetical protein [Verrucomicrobiota bacterium]